MSEIITGTGRTAVEKLGTPGVEQIKGKMLIAHREWLKRRLSPSDPAKADLSYFWSLLPKDSREALGNGILSGSFYDFRHLIRFDDAIVRVAGGERGAILGELGEFSAEMNIPKNALVGSIHAFFDFSTKLHHQFQSYGSSEYVQHNEKSGTMVYRGCENCHSPIFCASSVGFFRGALRLFGFPKGRVRESSCSCMNAPTCSFTMEWA